MSRKRRRRGASRPLRRIVDDRTGDDGVVTLFLECGHTVVRRELAEDQTMTRCEDCKADTQARRKAKRSAP